MDTISPKKRSALMSSIRSGDTKPERIVRSLLFNRGFRYRLHVKELPGKPDIALIKYRTAIFVHGCFWHGCINCDRGLRIPKTNTEKWVSKIKQNKERDSRVQKELEQDGWKVVVVWSCELTDRDALAERLVACLTGHHD